MEGGKVIKCKGVRKSKVCGLQYVLSKSKNNPTVPLESEELKRETRAPMLSESAGWNDLEVAPVSKNETAGQTI